MDDLLHHPQDDQHDRARHERHEDEAGAHRQADARRAPQRGRRRQAGDLVLGHEDRARAQEAHAGDDRRRDTAHAHPDHGALVEQQHRRDGLLLDQGNQRRAHAHQHVRAHARRTILDLTVDADHRADKHRRCDAQKQRADAQRLSKHVDAVQCAQNTFHTGNLLLIFSQTCQQSIKLCYSFHTWNVKFMLSIIPPFASHCKMKMPNFLSSLTTSARRYTIPSKPCDQEAPDEESDA